MSKDYTFSVMPSVSISRSRFARKSQHKTSFNLGRIIPIYCDEVLPGDTRSMDMAALVRMSNPIAPIMDNILLDYFAFFVPMRLTWKHWKEFMGENSAGAGIPVQQYSIPYLGDDDYSDISGYEDRGNPFTVGSYGDYFGLPVEKNDVVGRNKISALPFRALALIYNRWFRNQNIIAPLAVQDDDTNEVIVGELNDEHYSSFACDAVSVLKASKLPDYFTKALPYAQKGAAVSIPLGTTAPIVASATTALTTGRLLGVGQNIGTTPTAVDTVYNTSGSYVGNADVYADLSNATAATINQLRYAFQLQKLLEKDALYGSRYWEILNAHFGVQAPDASLQDPEYLGGYRQHINIDQVLQTTGATGTQGQTLGTPGANSVTGSKCSLFTKSFVEHGYIIIVAVARHESTYGQGINRMWSRQGRYDFYFPVFANLGAQDIKVKEIYADGSANDDLPFGYQEAWAEYRMKPSIATGLLRPSASNSLNYWTLGENFAAKPTLGKTFIEQGRGNLSRALVTGSTGPDFIADFYFQDIAVRPMPMYSIPGLIDHH